jgi:hypothetical protein
MRYAITSGSRAAARCRSRAVDRDGANPPLPALHLLPSHALSLTASVSSPAQPSSLRGALHILAHVYIYCSLCASNYKTRLVPSPLQRGYRAALTITVGGGSSGGINPRSPPRTQCRDVSESGRDVQNGRGSTFMSHLTHHTSHITHHTSHNHT